MYGIIQKMDMNVGYIISSHISFIAQHDSSRLSFPALITALCKARGVTSDSLTIKSLGLAINVAYVKINYWNLDDPTVTFRGPRKAKGKRSEVLPSSEIPPSAAPSSSDIPPIPASTPTPLPAPPTGPSSFTSKTLLSKPYFGIRFPKRRFEKL